MSHKGIAGYASNTVSNIGRYASGIASSIALAGLLALGSGCAPKVGGLNPSSYESSKSSGQNIATTVIPPDRIEEAKKILGVNSADSLAFLPGGYITSNHLAGIVSTVVALRTGNAEVSIAHEGGVLVQTNFYQPPTREEFISVCRAIDEAEINSEASDADQILTDDEINFSLEKAISEQLELKHLE